MPLFINLEHPSRIEMLAADFAEMPSQNKIFPTILSVMVYYEAFTLMEYA